MYQKKDLITIGKVKNHGLSNDKVVRLAKNVAGLWILFNKCTTRKCQILG